MKRKLLSVIMALTLAGSVFAGCGSEKAPENAGETPAETTESETADAAETAETEGEPVTLTVWAWDENFNIAAMKTAESYYENENVTLNIVGMSKEDVYVKLQTALAAGGSGLPDIVLLEDYVSAKYRTTFPGSFADLTDAFDWSKFLEFKVKAVSENDRVYAVPFDTGAAALYYRLDLVEQAGYTEEDMQNLTWDEFIEIGKTVTEKTGTPMMVEIANNKTTLIRAMMQSCGQWYFDENGEINMKNNESLKAAFETILEMKEAGILYEAESTEDRAGALNKGKVVSVVNAPWFISAIRNGENQEGLWRAARIPRFSDIETSTNASNVGGSSWYVMETSPNKQAAIDFLAATWQGNTDFYDQIMREQGAMGSYIDGYSTPVYEEGDAYFGGQNIYALFAEILPEVQPVNFGGYVSEANDAVTTALQNLFEGKCTVDEALEQAEAQLANQLGR